eukprot:SAG11_NODE_9973_length_865_cov_1.336815_1_plen_24_part_01
MKIYINLGTALRSTRVPGTEVEL